MRDPLREPNSMTGNKRGKPASRPTKARPDLAFDPIRAALREIHDSVAAEGIPDDFMDLLDRLGDAAGKQSDKR